MKQFLVLFALIPTMAFAQEMRFVIDNLCSSAGDGLTLKCTAKKQEFTIVKNGKRFAGINEGGGKFELKVLESTPHILVLQNPVSFDGTSTIHITTADRRFYWVEVAYSTILNEREITIRSGRRVR